MLRFTADASPWWLLLLVPALAAAGWWLYRVDFPGMTRPRRVILVTLRVILLLGLLLLAFRPNLVYERTLTYPGRVSFVLDNSRSMTVSDNRLSDGSALRLARRLSDERIGRQPLHEMATALEGAATRLASFERAARGADRSRDAYWDRVAEAREAIEKRYREAAKRAAAATEPVGALGEEAAQKLKRAKSRFEKARTGLDRFFGGKELPSTDAFDRYGDRIAGIAATALDLQAQLDAARVEGDADLAQAADRVRGRERRALVNEKLAASGPALERLGTEQGIERVGLMGGAADLVEADDLRVPEAEAGPTDLVGAVRRTVERESDFPLSAVVVVSDGRDVEARPSAPLEQLLAKEQVPLWSLPVGGRREPVDLSVVGVRAPPIAVANRPVTVRARLKAAMRKPRSLELRIRRDGEAVVERSVELEPGAERVVRLELTPGSPGHKRYTAAVEPIGDEVVPQANNTADFVMTVRKKPVRALVLDWKPRWETRFAINTLERLPYVETNDMVVLTGQEGELERGTARGSWPKSPEALALYDLVVLGELPDDTLTAQEWSNLRRWLERKGRTLCFLAPRSGAGGLPGGEAARALFPIGGEPAANAPLKRADAVGMTASAARHPLTAALAGILPSEASAGAALAPRSTALLTRAESGAPLLAVGHPGEGRVAAIDHPQLWRALNPTAHGAHQRLYVAMVTWAIESGWAGEKDGPRLWLEQRRARANRGAQVWVRGGGDAPVVEAVRGDEVVAAAEAEPAGAEAELRRAVFAELPPGEVTFRLRGAGGVATPRVSVVARRPELDYFARAAQPLTRLAEGSGGGVRPFTQLERVLERVEPKERVERSRTVWRLWTLPLVLTLLFVVLTAEWCLRKAWGRV